jgi:hypothetical protein
MADLEGLRRAVDLAAAGDWNGAHNIAQVDERDPLSCWLHACLHKMEGDASNSRYWYRRAHRRFEEFADPADELKAIRAEIADITPRS